MSEIGGKSIEWQESVLSKVWRIKREILATRMKVTTCFPGFRSIAS